MMFVVVNILATDLFRVCLSLPFTGTGNEEGYGEYPIGVLFGDESNMERLKNQEQKRIFCKRNQEYLE